MMEPHASIAAWEGDKLTLWTANQMVDWSRGDLARTLGIAKDQVRIVSPYIGGGFGGKLFVRAEALLAALGARAAQRPVKVALTRPLMFNNTTHRPATIQRLRIGATRDGKITAIGHESWSGDLKGGQPETAVMQTRLLYAGPNRMTAMRLAVLDLPEGNSMRAPGEAPGLMALEIAMDEMAEKLNMDPIVLRILNDTKVDPEKPGRPFSQRRLIDCLRTGAVEFGWKERQAQPGKRRDGRWLVGMGVAAAFRNNLVMQSAARVRLDGKGIDHGGNGHDGHRHGQLHHHCPDGGGNAGRDPEPCRRAPGRLGFSRLGRFGRAMGRQQFHGGRVCGLRALAPGHRRQAGL